MPSFICMHLGNWSCHNPAINGTKCETHEARGDNSTMNASCYLTASLAVALTLSTLSAAEFKLDLSAKDAPGQWRFIDNTAAIRDGELILDGRKRNIAPVLSATAVERCDAAGEVPGRARECRRSSVRLHRACCRCGLLLLRPLRSEAGDSRTVRTGRHLERNQACRRSAKTGRTMARCTAYLYR